MRPNAIAPGPVQTGWIPDVRLKHAEAMVWMGRVGEPDDIADAAVLLATRRRLRPTFITTNGHKSVRVLATDGAARR